jgi:hypothetical protein
MYPRFEDKPHLQGCFEPVLTRAIKNGQILLHMFPGEPWKFHLGVYTLSDWPEGTTHEDFYEYFRGIYQLQGDWSSFYRFYQSNTLPIHNIDIRIQPTGSIPFGIIVAQHISMAQTIVDFLKINLGEEHRGIRPWSSLGTGTRRYLCRRVCRDTNEGMRKLDSEPRPMFVLTKLKGTCDLLGGHAKLYELMDVAEHFAQGDVIQSHLWPSILQTVHKDAFYREVVEELGLVAYPNGNIGDRQCYYGRNTKMNQFIWIQFGEEEDMPIKVIITA